jgi:hypothetical protein
MLIETLISGLSDSVSLTITILGKSGLEASAIRNDKLSGASFPRPLNKSVLWRNAMVYQDLPTIL